MDPKTAQLIAGLAQSLRKSRPIHTEDISIEDDPVKRQWINDMTAIANVIARDDDNKFSIYTYIEFILQCGKPSTKEKQ